MMTTLWIAIGLMFLVILVSIIGRFQLWSDLEEGENVTLYFHDGWEMNDIITNKTNDSLFLPNVKVTVEKKDFILGHMPFDIFRKFE